jgi:hypothetical protein
MYATIAVLYLLETMYSADRLFALQALSRCRETYRIRPATSIS